MVDLNKIYNKKIPNFISRLNKKEITSSQCFNCLRETEKAIEKGYWKKFSKPMYYWYEMCDAEKREIIKYIDKYKPKTILELGFGSGRILNVLLKAKYNNKIFGVEKDSKIFKITKPLFKKSKNVYLFNENIDKFLERKTKYDLTIGMMNTIGNIDNLKLIQKIVLRSKQFIFTVYDRVYYKLRSNIYKSKGHINFFEKNKNYYFNDCWAKGLKSKSYSKTEIENICKLIGKKYQIKKISKLLFWVCIYD